MIFPFLSFLSVGSGASQALKWLANLTQASQLLDYVFMCITYIFFYRALKAQGYDRKNLPYRGWGQPYVAYAGMACMVTTVAIYGYTVFLPGWWNVGKFSPFPAPETRLLLMSHPLTEFPGTFFTYYTMVFVCIVLFSFWKLVKKTKFIKPEECDLVWERPVIDAYEAAIEKPLGLWEDFGQVFGYKKEKQNLE